MAEPAGIRRQALERLIASRGFVRVADASLELDVSEVTIRSDLGVLESSGTITRVHGGAMPSAALANRESSIEAMLQTDAAAKAAIAKRAARLVTSGQGIYLDAGSTALALAEALVERTDLHDVVVVTSGLTIALALERAIPRFTVVVTGGTLRPLQHSLVNPFAAPMLDALRLDLAFIGCNGIHPTGGVTNLNLAEAEIKTRVIASSRRRVLVADATKIGRIELAVIAPVGEFDTLVTAGVVEPGIRSELEALGLAIEGADMPAGAPDRLEL